MLYLITHAHTQQQRDADAATWVLSDRGEAQAAVLARQPFWETVDRIVLSSEPKTRLTVAPVLVARPLPVTVDARFDELKRPTEWTYDYVARVGEVFANPTRSIDGWEPAADALARFLAGVADLRKTLPGKGVVLVGHGLTLSLYRAHLLGLDHVHLDDWRNLSFAAVAQVDLATDSLLSDFNPVAGPSPRG